MGTLQWKKFAMDKIPIYVADNSEQKQFVDLVNRILAITKDDKYPDKEDKQAMVNALSKQIDKKFYEIYNLTLEEIKLVEEFEK